jgi:hypothetical protein
MSQASAVAVVLGGQALLMLIVGLMPAGGRKGVVLGSCIAAFALVALVTTVPLSRASPLADVQSVPGDREVACNQILKLAGDAGLVAKGADGRPVLVRPEDSSRIPVLVWSTLQACLPAEP